MKDRILFVCVGQGGGNVGQLFENKKYNCLFVNTSYDDLKTINAKHKLHITGTFGCNKDRDKALTYLQDSYNIIENAIDNRFPQQDLIFFIFTSGGGTGSGLSPALIQRLSKNNANKHYGAITILPSLSESLKSQMNAIEAYKDLIKISNLKNLIILDNNNIDDRFELNKKFVDMFDLLLNVSIPDERGIIDPSELETLITCKGSMYLIITKGYSSLDKDIDTNSINLVNNIINSVNKNVFTPFETGTCKYLAMSQCGEVDIRQVKKLVGTPIDTFIGYNGSINFTIMAGMPYPTQRIKELMNNVNKEYNQISLEHGTGDSILDELELPVFKENRNENINETQLLKIQKVKETNVFEEIASALGDSDNDDTDLKETKTKKIIDVEDIFKKFS